MKTSSNLLVGSLLLMAVAGCSEKKEDRNIIVSKPPVQVVSNEPERMEEFTHEHSVEWVGSVYKVSIHRFVADSLPLVTDEQGRRYHDNKIRVRITRRDGSAFFDRTFTKNDFASVVDDKYRRNGALLGLAFMEVDDDNIRFGGSIGSPDKLSDEFIPTVVNITRMGVMTIKRDTQLDTSSDSNLSEGTTVSYDDDEGV